MIPKSTNDTTRLLKRTLLLSAAACGVNTTIPFSLREPHSSLIAIFALVMGQNVPFVRDRCRIVIVVLPSFLFSCRYTPSRAPLDAPLEGKGQIGGLRTKGV